jgi:hypothetical protein
MKRLVQVHKVVPIVCKQIEMAFTCQEPGFCDSVQKIMLNCHKIGKLLFASDSCPLPQLKKSANERIWILLNNFMLISGLIGISQEVIMNCF